MRLVLLLSCIPDPDLLSSLALDTALLLASLCVNVCVDEHEQYSPDTQHTHMTLYEAMSRCADMAASVCRLDMNRNRFSACVKDF